MPQEIWTKRRTSTSSENPHWGDNLRKDVENVKCVNRDKQAKYLEELNHQKMSIDKYRLARENYNKDHLENIRKYQKHLENIDLKEIQNPIDKKNPFQYS